MKFGGLILNQKFPAVSVIIPVYNAEKFIGACLQSILAQTFKDFEVIAVDHFSTDDSAKIIESYVPKFGRNGCELKLLKLNSNFGNPCIPRNRGLNFSRGKYIYFIDADDLLIKTALEKLYDYAETYNVDAVCMHKYFWFQDKPDKLIVNNPKLISTMKKPAEFPVTVSENIAERINALIQGKIHVMPWLQFSRRDFLIANEIYFPKILAGEDDFWTMKLICCAKKILLIDKAFYLVRENSNSLTRAEKPVEQKIKQHMTAAIIGMQFMKEILNASDFLKKNPQYWYTWINHIIKFSFKLIFPDCANLPPHEVYKIFYEQFAQDTGEHAELISYLCSVINSQQKQLATANAKISKLEKILSKN